MLAHLYSLSALGYFAGGLLNTQRTLARKVLEKGADYVMALKGNQAKLREDVTWLFQDAQQGGFGEVDVRAFETTERGHGRAERRRCEVLSELSYLDEHRWPGLRSVAKVTSERTSQAKSSVETRYYLCSLEADPQKVLQAVRAHWGVENKLHWTLGVVFGEDAHSYVKGKGPENMAVLRQLTLNLLRQDKSKGSLKGKRKKAAWNDEFRAALLKPLVLN